MVWKLSESFVSRLIIIRVDHISSFQHVSGILYCVFWFVCKILFWIAIHKYWHTYLNNNYLFTALVSGTVKAPMSLIEKLCPLLTNTCPYLTKNCPSMTNKSPFSCVTHFQKWASLLLGCTARFFLRIGRWARQASETFQQQPPNISNLQAVYLTNNLPLGNLFDTFSV